MPGARPAERGFTFLEIIVVVMLIALVSAVMITRIGARRAHLGAAESFRALPVRRARVRGAARDRHGAPPALGDRPRRPAIPH
jgi:prepilin-type N-terminal cleavage/methylation domain-containing protein